MSDYDGSPWCMMGSTITLVLTITLFGQSRVAPKLKGNPRFDSCQHCKLQIDDSAYCMVEKQNVDLITYRVFFLERYNFEV